MHFNYVILHGNLCYDVNTDPEHIIYFKRTLLAAFTQLKPIPFLLKEITWITKNKCVKSIYIFRISLARE